MKSKRKLFEKTVKNGFGTRFSYLLKINDMKKIILVTIAFFGLQIASAQTVTPVPTEKKQKAPVPAENKNQTEKKSGSTGTYTTGAGVPDNSLPSDTIRTNSRKPKPLQNPEGHMPKE